jgi:hypothetical protein
MHETDAPDRANVDGLRRRAQATNANVPRGTAVRAVTQSHPLNFALGHTAPGR